ncbi:hypothetical protein CEXT_214921 [Caerostris extrusa]|uniref:Uncharacterized protein n=1 Tax=Caerostris extrusa TaxID=172846 RepID=A0AAV4M3R1_CAEEX|nr:hypothetical protein CEXT_214921 [Caerostris extrusa]
MVRPDEVNPQILNLTGSEFKEEIDIKLSEINCVLSGRHLQSLIAFLKDKEIIFFFRTTPNSSRPIKTVMVPTSNSAADMEIAQESLFHNIKVTQLQNKSMKLLAVC